MRATLVIVTMTLSDYVSAPTGVSVLTLVEVGRVHSEDYDVNLGSYNQCAV